MKRLICWLRGHRWGSWLNPKTQQYHSVCCERCGMWYGDSREAKAASGVHPVQNDQPKGGV